MKNKYRIDWHAGMRLTDEIFRSSDEYYQYCLQPLYAHLANGDYGFLELPIFRYELTDSTLSITELDAKAITYSGKLIHLSFVREDIALFQDITLPDTTAPIILLIDKSSDKTIKIKNHDNPIPLCDADYQILVRLESEHYNNPDAVPFARLVYKHGWSLDSSFVAPCVTLRANGSLLRASTTYVVALDTLMQLLKEAIHSHQIMFIMSALPTLARVVVEVQKEADKMSPRHLITLMQEVIKVLLTLSEVEDGVVIPNKDRCVSFVESHYTPYVISEMINEGIHLTQALTDIVKSFSVREVKIPDVEIEMVRPQRRINSTDSIRKKHH